MITGLDLAYRDLDLRPPADFQSGPTDDPADENVNLDEDEHLPWPDAERIARWWAANRARFTVGTAYFLGTPRSQQTGWERCPMLSSVSAMPPLSSLRSANQTRSCSKSALEAACNVSS